MSVFQVLFASIGKMFILVARLDTRGYDSMRFRHSYFALMSLLVAPIDKNSHI